MTQPFWPQVLFFCLASGAALGALYAALRGAGTLLRAGRLLTGVLDTLFCLLCGAVVFLCALAVDKGRLRAFQLALQLLGGWSAAVVFTPLCTRAALFLQKIFGRIGGFFGRRLAFLRQRWQSKRIKRRKKSRKTRKKRKKAEKRA